MKKIKMKWFLLSCCIGLCAILIIPQSVVLASEITFENMDVGGSPVGICPEIDGEEMILLPDAYDCRIFYKCESGVAVLGVCPAGLYFNCEFNICDYPERVKNCPCLEN